MFPLPSLEAQSLAATVAHPPRMPLVLGVDDLMLPFTGSRKLTRPFAFRVIAPRSSVVEPLAPLDAFTVINPELMVVPANVCETALPSLPLTTSAHVVSVLFELTTL